MQVNADGLSVNNISKRSAPVFYKVTDADAVNAITRIPTAATQVPTTFGTRRVSRRAAASSVNHKSVTRTEMPKNDPISGWSESPSSGAPGASPTKNPIVAAIAWTTDRGIQFSGKVAASPASTAASPASTGGVAIMLPEKTAADAIPALRRNIGIARRTTDSARPARKAAVPTKSAACKGSANGWSMLA